jgi:hypothetical protein
MKKLNNSVDIYNDPAKSLMALAFLIACAILDICAITGFGGMIEFDIPETLFIWFTTSLFIIFIPLLIKLSFSGGPILRISHQGLMVRNAFVKHHILWSDFAGTTIVKFGEQNLIYFFVQNPERYLAQSSWITRKILTHNYQKTGHIASISSLFLSIEIERILYFIDQYSAVV